MEGMVATRIIKVFLIAVMVQEVVAAAVLPISTVLSQRASLHMILQELREKFSVQMVAVFQCQLQMEQMDRLLPITLTEPLLLHPLVVLLFCLSGSSTSTQFSNRIKK